MHMDIPPESIPAAVNAPIASLEPPWEHLHPMARLGMRLSAVLGIALSGAPATALVLAAWDPPGLSTLAKAGLFLLVLALLLLAGWRYAGARYARTEYALDAVGLRIRRGVVWRGETLVPRSRVQHLDIERGPIERRYGLATVIVHTAGTRQHALRLAGLPDADAVALRDALVPAASVHDDVL